MTTETYETVDASPTKEFFVEMLTRDVRLSMAILDLIDNCIDGALRIRGMQAFDGLTVNITFDEEQFIIHDNCGGIPEASRWSWLKSTHFGLADRQTRRALITLSADSAWG